MRLPELARPEAIATLNELAAAWPELVWPADAPARAYRTRGTAEGLAVEPDAQRCTHG